MKRTVLSCLLLACFLLLAGGGVKYNASSRGNAGKAPGTIPRGGECVDCGFDRRIYKNKLSREAAVTVQFTDKCIGASSIVEVVDRNGDVIGSASDLVGDGETETFTFPVPSEGEIRFKCLGTEGRGNCFYTILSAT